MHTVLLMAVTLGLAASTSVGSYGHEAALSLESYGGGGGGGGDAFAALGSLNAGLSSYGGQHAELSLGGGGGGGVGGGSLYSGHSSYEAPSEHSSGGSSGGDLGDYHHGVSIVAGPEGHGTSFDLTKHGGGDGHSGPYGGTFIASAKYEGHSGVAHKIADGDSHGAGLIAFGSPHYTDVLSASEGSSSGGGGGGGYKWGFVGEQ